MNPSMIRSHSLVFFLGALSALTTFAQPQPAVPAAPAAGAGRGAGAAGAAPAAAARAGGGGGRGGVSYSPAQAVALSSLNIPAALAQAVTTANADLVRASLAEPSNPADIRAKADAVAKALLAQASALIGELAKAQPPLNLTPAQLESVFANNGLARGGNTSPGGNFPHEDYFGFTKIFDGKTFTGWSGETDGWIIGEDSLQMNTARLGGQHHIHFTGLPNVSPILKDFDFKVEMQIHSTTGGFNGGVQYRSRLLSAAHSANGQARGIYDPATIADPLGKPLPANITTLAAATAAGITGGNPWQVSGYQFDCNNNMGSLYEGQGRGVVVNAGEIVQLFPNGLKFVIGHTAPNPSSFIKPQGEWNQIEIIARGNTMIHMLNGQVITVTIDDDPMRRAFQGILSLQDEGGEIWYRNVYLKNLDPAK